MSAIQVRDIKGNWSEELQGIDKRYFIKKAFITEYRDLYERTEGDLQLNRTDKVLAEYDSLEKMVEDGWRMGS